MHFSRKFQFFSKITVTTFKQIVSMDKPAALLCAGITRLPRSSAFESFSRGILFGIFRFLTEIKHKSELNVSTQRLKHRDHPFISAFSLNLVEKKLWPQTSPFFDIIVNF